MPQSRFHPDAPPRANYELGTRFQSSASGQITALRFWKDSNETGIHTGHIWNASGALLTSVAFLGETASGWQQQNLTNPLPIIASTEYLASANTGNTYYVATAQGFATQIINGHLSSIVGGNGRYGPPGQYPAQTFNANNYFRDVVFVVGGCNLFPSKNQLASITMGFATSWQRNSTVHKPGTLRRFASTSL